MANNENLKPVRTKSEARERGQNGGKASGESRRRKADFRRTQNLLLTAEINSPEWTPALQINSRKSKHPGGAGDQWERGAYFLSEI